MIVIDSNLKSQMPKATDLEILWLPPMNEKSSITAITTVRNEQTVYTKSDGHISRPLQTLCHNASSESSSSNPFTSDGSILHSGPYSTLVETTTSLAELELSDDSLSNISSASSEETSFLSFSDSDLSYSPSVVSTEEYEYYPALSHEQYHGLREIEDSENLSSISLSLSQALNACRNDYPEEEWDTKPQENTSKLNEVSEYPELVPVDQIKSIAKTSELPVSSKAFCPFLRETNFTDSQTSQPADKMVPPKKMETSHAPISQNRRATVDGVCCVQYSPSIYSPRLLIIPTMEEIVDKTFTISLPFFSEK